MLKTGDIESQQRLDLAKKLIGPPRRVGVEPQVHPRTDPAANDSQPRYIVIARRADFHLAIAKSVHSPNKRLAAQPATAGVNYDAILNRIRQRVNWLCWREMLHNRANRFAEQASERIENAQLHGAPQRVAVASAWIVTIER